MFLNRPGNFSFIDKKEKKKKKTYLEVTKFGVQIAPEVTVHTSLKMCQGEETCKVIEFMRKLFQAAAAVYPRCNSRLLIRFQGRELLRLKTALRKNFSCYKSIINLYLGIKHLILFKKGFYFMI